MLSKGSTPNRTTTIILYFFFLSDMLSRVMVCLFIATLSNTYIAQKFTYNIQWHCALHVLKESKLSCRSPLALSVLQKVDSLQSIDAFGLALLLNKNRNVLYKSPVPIYTILKARCTSYRIPCPPSYNFHTFRGPQYMSEFTLYISCLLKIQTYISILPKSLLNIHNLSIYTEKHFSMFHLKIYSNWHGTSPLLSNSNTPSVVFFFKSRVVFPFSNQTSSVSLTLVSFNRCPGTYCFITSFTMLRSFSLLSPVNSIVTIVTDSYWCDIFCIHIWCAPLFCTKVFHPASPWFKPSWHPFSRDAIKETSLVTTHFCKVHQISLSKALWTGLFIFTAPSAGL